MEELIEILKNINPDVDYLTCDDLIEQGILTSFDLVMLVVEISETFGVSIPAHKITPEHFKSAGEIYQLIQEQEEEC